MRRAQPFAVDPVSEAEFQAPSASITIRKSGMKAHRYLVLFVALLLAACNSGDPIEGPDPSEVSGQYTIDALEFQLGGVTVADVRERLVVGDSFLELWSNGDFILRYRFADEPGLNGAAGSFDLRTTNLTLHFESGDPERLLLPTQFRLERDLENQDLLSTRMTTHVNLHAYDPSRFSSGQTNVEGVLHARLVRR